MELATVSIDVPRLTDWMTPVYDILGNAVLVLIDWWMTTVSIDRLKINLIGEMMWYWILENALSDDSLWYIGQRLGDIYDAVWMMTVYYWWHMDTAQREWCYHAMMIYECLYMYAVHNNKISDAF